MVSMVSPGFTPTCVERCVISPGIMGMSPRTRSSMWPWKICQPDTSEKRHILLFKCFDIFLSIYLMRPLLSRIRELSSMRIGTLVRISGQVVRTHPVHPELVRYPTHTSVDLTFHESNLCLYKRFGCLISALCLQVSGTFQCMDCQAMIKDVPQQFKYSPPTICRNPVCSNRARFHLDTHKSKFIDFQKVASRQVSVTCRTRNRVIFKVWFLCV